MPQNKGMEQTKPAQALELRSWYGVTSCQALPNGLSLLSVLLRVLVKRSSPGSRRRRTRQGASTTSHSGIRGLLRCPDAEPP